MKKLGKHFKRPELRNGSRKTQALSAGPRTWLLLCLLGVAAILVIRSEIRCLCLFLACLLIHLLAGNGGKILLRAVLPHFLRHWLVGCASDGQRSRLFGQLHAVQHRHRQPEGAGSPLLCHLPGGEPTGSLMAALQNCICPRPRGSGRQLYCASFRQSPGNTRPSVLPRGSVGSG